MNWPFLNFKSFTMLQMGHAITTRSLNPPQAEGPYADLNLAFHVGDDPAHVRQNRRDVAAQLHYDPARLHSAQQTHGTRVQLVTGNEPARGALDLETAWPDTDALITGHADVPLMIMVADCAPLLLADFDKWIFAVVHAGWRGAAGGIASNTVRAMCEMGARPEKISVGIGPHLCPQCFETGEEVAEAAAAIAPASILRGGVKPHLNLDALLRTDLQTEGVKKVETLPNCPRCENEVFFSHRAQNGTAGRFALVAWWNSR